MKKFTFLFLLVYFMFSYAGIAQDVLIVEPGVGTLNAAIKANGGNKIYQLKAGEWYQLDGIIENVDYHLQILGQKPQNNGKPATLQTGANASGAVFDQMFDAKGDISIRNVYLVNADLNGVIGGSLLTNSKKDARTSITKCVLDPVSKGDAIKLAGGNSKMYFKNNLAIRAGHQLNPNDGHFFHTDNASGVGFDTLFVQNNTFVCMGTTMHSGGFNKYVNNFSKWDHNTFVEQKSQIDWSCFEKEYYWTNNLMFDVQTQPWNTPWQPMPGADAGYPKPALIYADTIPGDVLPSKTIQFVEYNSHYRNPKFYTLVDELNAQGLKDGKTHIYLMPILWPADSAKISRETKMFADDASFPYWKYGNTTTDVDPKWVDARIYSMSDKFVEWTKPATQIHAMSYPAGSIPPASTWTQYHWDPDGDVSNNLTWPVFNGAYTNEALLTASIEGLPMGDLNWFPEAKAIWQKNITKIDAHMRTANDSKIDITTAIQSIKSSDISTSCYPNPFSNELTISYTVKNSAGVKLSVFTLTGQAVAELVNQSKVEGSYTIKWNGKNAEGKSVPNGVYFYKLQIGDDAISNRIIKLK